MIKSNVAIRSNVFVRESPAVEQDRAFVAQVRGRAALETLLARLEPGMPRVDAARKHFSHGQLAQVAWQARCSGCGAFPEGPVSVDGHIEVRFRCPRHACQSAQYSARTMLIDVEVIRRCVEVMQRPFEVIVQEALSQPGVEPPPVQLTGITRVPITVRMTLTQKYIYSDAYVEHALRTLIANGGG